MNEQLNKWIRARKALCEKWGITKQQAAELLDVMCYSDIPDWSDVDIALTKAEPLIRAKIAAEIRAQSNRTEHYLTSGGAGMQAAARIAAGEE